MQNKLISMTKHSIQILQGDTYNVGIDQGGTSVSGGLFDDNGLLVQGSDFKYKTITINNKAPHMSDTDLPQVSADALAQKTDNYKNQGAQINQIGISFAGPVNKKGVVIKAPNIFGPTLENIPFADIVANSTKLKTGVANDMVAAGYGQMKWGSAQGLSNFLVFTVSTGIGANTFLDHEPIIGKNGMAGEIGHLSVFGPNEMEKARQYFCGCGKWGHLEAISSGNSAALITLNRAINYYLRNDSRIESSQVLTELKKEAFKYAESIANNDTQSEKIREVVNKAIGKGAALGDWFSREVYNIVIPPVAQALVASDTIDDMEKIVLVGSYGLKMPGYIDKLNSVLTSYLEESGFAFKSSPEFASNMVIRGANMRAEKAAASIPWQTEPS
jgi:glucokinase